MFPKDVYRIFDRTTRPAKEKRAICVCDRMKLFLRLNSRSLWKPHHLIFAVNCDFLDHDSYVELRSLIRYLDEDIAVAQHLGRLSHPVAKSIMDAVEAAPTFSQRNKDLIRDRWGF